MRTDSIRKANARIMSSLEVKERDKEAESVFKN